MIDTRFSHRIVLEMSLITLLLQQSKQNYYFISSRRFDGVETTMVSVGTMSPVKVKHYDSFLIQIPTYVEEQLHMHAPGTTKDMQMTVNLQQSVTGNK